MGNSNMPWDGDLIESPPRSIVINWIYAIEKSGKATSFKGRSKRIRKALQHIGPGAIDLVQKHNYRYHQDLVNYSISVSCNISQKAIDDCRFAFSFSLWETVSAEKSATRIAVCAFHDLYCRKPETIAKVTALILAYCRVSLYVFDLVE